MDFQRLALIAALALVSVMLLTEWVRFRDEHPAAVPSAQAPVAPAVPAAPSLDEAAAAPASDLPVAAAQMPEQGAAATSAPATSAPATIDVRTDTLSVRIALHGGDIVSVALPRFPAKLDAPEVPFQLLEQSATHSYVAESGLSGTNGTDRDAATRPVFSAARAHYELAPGAETLDVDLVYAAADGVTITKRFHFQRGRYVVGLEYRIDNQGQRPWKAALFGQLRRDDQPDPGAQGGALGIQPFIGFASRTDAEPYRKRTFDDITDEPYKEQAHGGWIALVQHYFISAWIPDPGQTNQFEMQRGPSGLNLGRFIGPQLTIAPGAQGVLAARFYAGPKNQRALADISPGLDLTVDYGWLWWIAQPLFALLHLFATGSMHIFGFSLHLGSGVGNWGVAIILLTILVKAAFFQLSATSYKSMAKMRMLQPKMLELRDRHGDDRQKLSQETMELYRKEKVNPLGGCLPILIQMPVFLALYWVLLESVELRQAAFFGWIRDLSVMDPYFVLPLLMGASMYFQQKLNPPPPDPVQAKVFQFMPVIFTVFFLFFPAGLVLYWLVNNLLSITQQWVITRQIEKASKAA